VVLIERSESNSMDEWSDAVELECGSGVGPLEEEEEEEEGEC
jgi:hypothetical protein